MSRDNNSAGLKKSPITMEEFEGHLFSDQHKSISLCLMIISEGRYESVCIHPGWCRWVVQEAARWVWQRWSWLLGRGCRLVGLVLSHIKASNEKSSQEVKWHENRGNVSMSKKKSNFSIAIYKWKKTLWVFLFIWKVTKQNIAIICQKHF